MTGIAPGPYGAERVGMGTANYNEPSSEATINIELKTIS